MGITWESIKNSASYRNIKRTDIPFRPLISLCEITDLFVLIDDLYFPGQQSELFELFQRRTARELADIYVQLENQRTHPESNHARDCAYLAIDNLRCAIIARTRIDPLFLAEINYYHQAALNGSGTTFGKFLVTILNVQLVNPQETPIYRFICNDDFAQHVRSGNLYLDPAILNAMGHQTHSYVYSDATLFEVKTKGARSIITRYQQYRENKLVNIERAYPMRHRVEPVLPPIMLKQIIRQAKAAEGGMIELNPDELRAIKSKIGSLVQPYKIGGVSFQTEPSAYTRIVNRINIFLAKHPLLYYTAFGMKHLIWTMSNVLIMIPRDFLEYLTRRKDTGVILALFSGGTLLLGGTELFRPYLHRTALVPGAISALTEIAFMLITATSNDNNPLKKFRDTSVKQFSEDTEHFHHLIVKMDRAKLRNWQKNGIFLFASLVGLSVFSLAKPWLSELILSVTGEKDDSQVVEIVSIVLAAFEGVGSTMGAYLGTVTFAEDTQIRWLNPSLIDSTKSCLSRSSFGAAYLLYLLITVVGTVPVFAAPFKNQFTELLGEEIHKQGLGWGLGGLASLTLVCQVANPTYKIFFDIKTRQITPKTWQEAIILITYMMVLSIYMASTFGLSEASLHDEFSDSPDAKYLRNFFASCVTLSMAFPAYEAISDVSSSIYKAVTQGASRVYTAAKQSWWSFFSSPRARTNGPHSLLLQDNDYVPNYLSTEAVAHISNLHNQLPTRSPESSLEGNYSQQPDDEDADEDEPEIYMDALDYILIKTEETFVDASTFEISHT